MNHKTTYVITIFTHTQQTHNTTNSYITRTVMHLLQIPWTIKCAFVYRYKYTN